MGIKKESIAEYVVADISMDPTPYIIANPNGQIKLLHEDSPGFIALFKKTKDGTSQYHYKLDEIESHLKDWMKPDSYVSMNTFYTPKRLITNLKEIRTAFVDIDCQNIGQSAELTANLLKRDYFNQSIPTPNMMIYSGRGLNLVWFLEPLSGLAVERWGKLQKAIYETVKSLGADSKATDAARVFRLAGTVNSKSNTQVFCEVLHEEKSTFDGMIADYFPSILKSARKPEVTKKKPKGAVRHLFNEYTLVKARKDDIGALIEMRSGKMEGCREYALFLYRYWSLAERDNEEYAKEAMLTLNNRFNRPLPEREALADTKSAERYHDSTEPFKITNATLIEWLDITKEEQRHLSTIISPAEKRRRNTDYQRDKRRDSGVQERSKYESDRQSQRAQKIAQLRELRAKWPAATQKELANLLSVSVPTVKKYIAELKG